MSQTRTFENSIGLDNTAAVGVALGQIKKVCFG